MKGLFIGAGLTGLVLVVLGAWFLIDVNAKYAFLDASGLLEQTSVEPTRLSPSHTVTLTPPPLTVTPTLSVPPTATRTITATQVPTATQSNMVCPNTYPTNLKVGIKVYASYYPALPNRIRKEPSTKSTILGLIHPGEEAVTVDGPACSEGWIWWKIRKTDGLTGWTAEGDGKDYWILPK